MAPLGSSLCILFLLCLSTFCGLASGSSPRIAVIGAGIAGSSAAYYLRNEWKRGDIEIHFFEKSNRLGYFFFC
jgi:ribulose 1,5-bisphosphate synthetase/thiazole synthase